MRGGLPVLSQPMMPGPGWSDVKHALLGHQRSSPGPSQALAANEGGACIVGSGDTAFGSFCGVVSPKAASRGGRAAAAAVGALMGVTPKTVPGIDGVMPESSIDEVITRTMVAAAKGACYEGGVRKKTGEGVWDGSDSMSDETSITSPGRNLPVMGTHSDLMRLGCPSCSANTAPGVSPSPPSPP